MKKIGMQTYTLSKPINIISTASIVGPKEKDGPLSEYFDLCLDDEFWGEKTWEKAESKIIKETASLAIKNSNLSQSSIDFCFAGDLLNQCIASNFGLRDFNIPHIGLFGACSTFVESLITASFFLNVNYDSAALCAVSSHFCSAEKQFRFPLELGNQRPPSSQWTVTGSGAAILSNKYFTSSYPKITSFTPGKIIDKKIKDANNMGAAMAPAAYNTIKTHLNDLSITPNYYDMIFTGDLGHIGKDILIDLFKIENIDLSKNYNDCGVMIFDKETQDTHSGGSGCGCIASVFSGYIYKNLLKRKQTRILLVATGALMNTTTSQQGESIPGIAHAISIEI